MTVTVEIMTGILKTTIRNRFDKDFNQSAFDDAVKSLESQETIEGTIDAVENAVGVYEIKAFGQRTV